MSADADIVVWIGKDVGPDWPPGWIVIGQTVGRDRDVYEWLPLTEELAEDPGMFVVLAEGLIRRLERRLDMEREQQASVTRP
jgi:hypothetical protein